MIEGRRITLARPTSFLEGIGIHTGKPCCVQIRPAEDGTRGIVLYSARTGATVPADTDHVIDTRRCTVLGTETFSVQTVEHLISACSGMGVTDATVVVDGPEIPILDGSALPFVEAILEVGLTDLPGSPQALALDSPVALTHEGSTMIAYPAEVRSISVIIDYPDRAAIGVQAAVHFGVNYRREVAPARTYGFLSEIESLQQQGLAQGAALEHGIALLEDGSADPRTPVRFANELARHKLLDVMGDLALIGKTLRAGVVAIRPSHTLTTRFARLLAAEHPGDEPFE